MYRGRGGAHPYAATETTGARPSRTTNDERRVLAGAKRGPKRGKTGTDDGDRAGQNGPARRKTTVVRTARPTEKTMTVSDDRRI